MQLRKSVFVVQVGVFLSSLVLSNAAAAQTMYYVDAVAGSDSNLGTELSPFLTINKAVEEAYTQATPQPTIVRIKPGTYDQTHEQGAGGFPILIEADPDLQSGHPIVPFTFEAAEATMPVIGGGVADSDVLGLFEVRATAQTEDDAADIVFKDLVFAGENTPGKNAPSAVFALSADGYEAEVTLDNCTIERSEMNDPDPLKEGHPSITAIAGPVLGEGDDPTMELTVVACVIHPNTPGGIVTDLGPDCFPDEGHVDLTVQNSTFTLQGAQGAQAAVDAILEGFVGTSPLNGRASISISGNLIDSVSASGPGARFTKGIAIGGEARHGGSVQLRHSEVFVQGNKIHGCGSYGIYFLSFTDLHQDSGANIQSWFVDRNIVTDNTGFGIVFDGLDGLTETSAYLLAYLRGNIIADNGNSGVYLHEINAGNSGRVDLLNCTVANNGEYGIQYDQVAVPGFLENVENCIFWSNSLGSADGWDPCNDAVSFRFNNWGDAEDCVTTGCSPNPADDYNISVNPLFVAPALGDYHLSSGSCCIDRGINNPIATAGGPPAMTVDIDMQPRMADGDDDGRIITDIGADEVPDPTP